MRRVVLLCLAVSSTWCCGPGESSDARSEPAPPSPSAPQESELEQPAHVEFSGDPRPPIPAALSLPDDFLRGVCLAHNYQSGGSRGYGSEVGDETLSRLQQMGVTWVSLTPFGYMRSVDANVVHFRPHAGGAGENDERLRAAIRAAHARGLRVQLKPHVWISGGAYRGRVDPAGGVESFMASYGRFLLHYAELAADEEVGALVVGVELDGLAEREPEAWRALIARVRAVYAGPIAYAANWDAVDRIRFWDAVDAIGVQFYAPLAPRPGASIAELTTAAGERLDAYRGLSERLERPIWLTEVGYRAARDGYVRPYLWPERADEVEPAPNTQAAGYVALLRAIANRPFVRGVFVWKYFTDPQTNEEGRAGFSPRGRLAEDVLRAAFGVGPG